MNYFTSMSQVLGFKPAAVKGLRLKQLQYFCIINVLVLGLVYGSSAAFFSKIVLIGKGYDASSFNALKIVVAGVPVAFLMHAGAALFVWVFLSAIGGKANFILSYFTMGVAAISLWPLALFVAALQTGSRMPFMMGLTVFFSLYAFAVTVRVIKDAFRLTQVKMAIATSVTMIYIGCFLYLWV
ncbi:MAG: hypothetical protein KKE44_17790 [Proteobacteria bacterium]|nr:hypothetical protein [Pseudomonadota bacterium]MBU1584585.1 hypothetical protein [Pseudomonadota bacterium]MBU2453006.1 hypothetical protein [Pseudomonadota bacterium]MBU2631312.1 hypothetical protein [Pseudomonadota bacterium]